MQGLRAKADDKDFQAKWRAIKYQNKERLAAKIKVERLPRLLFSAAWLWHACLHCRHAGTA